MNLGGLSLADGKLVFNVTHESVAEAQKSLIEPLEEMLKSKSPDSVVFDFAGAPFLSRVEVEKVSELAKMMRLLDLDVGFRHISAQLSLAMSRWADASAICGRSGKWSD